MPIPLIWNIATDNLLGSGSNGATYNSGGATWKFLCGIITFSTAGSLGNLPGTDLRDCTSKCPAQPSCVSTSYFAGICYPKDSVITSSNQEGVDITVKVIPLSSTDTCPGLSTDGPQKRIVGSTEYKFYCGKWVVTSLGLVKPPYKVNSLQQCLEDCNGIPYVSS